MRAVNIEKERLRKIITENRDIHLADYEESLEGYREAFKLRLESKLTRLNAGEIPSTHFRDMPMPYSHVDDYDQALEMLDYSTDDVIELTHDEFAQYVRDDWGWKQTFNATKMSYNNG